jgi:hypothetical protein
MNPEEQLKLEHSTLLEEFKTLREEILWTLDASRKVSDYAIAAIAALITGAVYIIQLRMPILFLISPLLLYGLAWKQMKYAILTHDLSNYLNEDVLPRIRQILAELSPDSKHDFNSLMSWESRAGSLLRHHSLQLLPITGASYGIPLLAALVSLCAYFSFIFQNSLVISVVDAVIIAVNVLALLYSVIWGFRIEFRLE